MATRFEFEFQFQDTPNVWLKVEIPLTAHLAAMSSGLLYNKPITKVKLFEVTDSGHAVSMVYDIQAAKSGGQIWSLLQNS